MGRFFILIIYLQFLFSLTNTTLILKPSSVHFPDIRASYDVYKKSICGDVHVADPLNGCSMLSNPVVAPNGTTDFVLIIRGACNYETKIRNAQAAGYQAAIVYNDGVNMEMNTVKINPEGINIHATYVSFGAGQYLKDHARGEARECCLVPSPDSSTHWYWILVVVVVLFLAMSVASSTFRACMRGHIPESNPPSPEPMQEQSAQQQRRSLVNALPSIVFTSEISNQDLRELMCAICLEEYQEGDNLKVLPCTHVFHASCVGEWLDTRGIACPLCRHDIRRPHRQQNIELGIV